MASPSEVQSTTRAVLAEFCSYDEMFTALDVSNEVKNRITGVRHREISPVVREVFEDGELDGDYTRTLIDVTTPQGKTVQAYLYHSKGRDPGDYGTHQRAQRAAAPVLDSSGSSSASAAPAAAPAQPKPKPKPKPAPATSNDDGSSELSVGIGSDGSATLPRSFIERAGIRGDEVALDSAGFGSALALYEVDEDADEDEAPLEVLEYEAGDVLRIPASYLGSFDRQSGLRAVIELGKVKLEAG